MYISVADGDALHVHVRDGDATHLALELRVRAARRVRAGKRRATARVVRARTRPLSCKRFNALLIKA